MLQPLVDRRADAHGASRSGLRAHVVTGDAGFRALRPEWNRLVDGVDPPSPFISWEWTDAWWRHLRRDTGCELAVLTLRDGESLLGIAPFYRRRIGPPAAEMRALLPIGWEPGHGWSITEMLEPVFPEADRRLLLSALATWLEQQRMPFAVIPGMRAGDLLTPWCDRHTVARGAGTPFLYRALPGDWESFLGSLNKSLRDNAKYYPRLLHRHGRQAAFSVAATSDEVRATLPVLLALHRARAAAPAAVVHHDYFASASRRAFIEAAAPALAARGQLRIGVLAVDGAPVAAQMWLENAGVMFVYYSGYDPRWSRYSVAFIALLDALQDAMSRGIGRVEFLAGLGQFKERWSPQRRLRHNVTLAAHPALFRSVMALSPVRRLLRRFS